MFWHFAAQCFPSAAEGTKGAGRPFSRRHFPAVGHADVVLAALVSLLMTVTNNRWQMNV